MPFSSIQAMVDRFDSSLAQSPAPLKNTNRGTTVEDNKGGDITPNNNTVGTRSTVAEEKYNEKTNGGKDTGKKDDKGEGKSAEDLKSKQRDEKALPPATSVPASSAVLGPGSASKVTGSTAGPADDPKMKGEPGPKQVTGSAGATAVSGKGNDAQLKTQTTVGELPKQMTGGVGLVAVGKTDTVSTSTPVIAATALFGDKDKYKTNPVKTSTSIPPIGNDPKTKSSADDEKTRTSVVTGGGGGINTAAMGSVGSAQINSAGKGDDSQMKMNKGDGKTIAPLASSPLGTGTGTGTGGSLSKVSGVAGTIVGSAADDIKSKSGNDDAPPKNLSSSSTLAPVILTGAGTGGVGTFAASLGTTSATIMPNNNVPPIQTSADVATGLISVNKTTGEASTANTGAGIISTTTTSTNKETLVDNKKKVPTHGSLPSVVISPVPSASGGMSVSVDRTVGGGSQGNGEKTQSQSQSQQSPAQPQSQHPQQQPQQSLQSQQPVNDPKTTKSPGVTTSIPTPTTTTTATTTATATTTTSTESRAVEKKKEEGDKGDNNDTIDDKSNGKKQQEKSTMKKGKESDAAGERSDSDSNTISKPSANTPKPPSTADDKPLSLRNKNVDGSNTKGSDADRSVEKEGDDKKGLDVDKKGAGAVKKGVSDDKGTGGNKGGVKDTGKVVDKDAGKGAGEGLDKDKQGGGSSPPARYSSEPTDEIAQEAMLASPSKGRLNKGGSGGGGGGGRPSSAPVGVRTNRQDTQEKTGRSATDKTGTKSTNNKSGVGVIGDDNKKGISKDPEVLSDSEGAGTSGISGAGTRPSSSSSSSSVTQQRRGGKKTTIAAKGDQATALPISPSSSKGKQQRRGGKDGCNDGDGDGNNDDGGNDNGGGDGKEASPASLPPWNKDTKILIPPKPLLRTKEMSVQVGWREDQHPMHPLNLINH